MSMRREEAFKKYKAWRDLGYGHSTMPSSEVLVMALDALHPITREQVEKVWRGEWQMVSNGSGVCSECHRQDKIDPLAKFCRYCGAPMTNKAVDMVMERLGEIKSEA